MKVSCIGSAGFFSETNWKRHSVCFLFCYDSGIFRTFVVTGTEQSNLGECLWNKQNKNRSYTHRFHLEVNYFNPIKLSLVKYIVYCFHVWGDLWKGVEFKYRHRNISIYSTVHYKSTKSLLMKNYKLYNLLFFIIFMYL